MAMLPRSLIVAVAVALLASCAAAAPASAQRLVPQNFFGTVFDSYACTASAAAQDRHFTKMAESGVETARLTFPWTALEPTKGRFTYDRTDRQVTAAARHGIELLPAILYTPEWARVDKRIAYSPPRSNADFNLLMKKVIQRYGPRGTFWDANPTLPRKPIRAWQIWNEPNNDVERYWDAGRHANYRWPGGYARLLTSANRTIKRYDPGARTVLGGITGAAWLELRRLYKFGVRNAFDVAALQIYPETVSHELEAIQRMREELVRAKDADVRIWVTEVAFPASKGVVKPINRQVQQTPSGMAARLTELYAKLAQRQKKWGLERVYWYTWASRYGKHRSAFDHSGLVSSPDGERMDPQPALTAYRRSAQRAQGCVKNVFGRCR